MLESRAARCHAVAAQRTTAQSEKRAVDASEVVDRVTSIICSHKHASGEPHRPAEVEGAAAAQRHIRVVHVARCQQPRWHAIAAVTRHPCNSCKAPTQAESTMLMLQLTYRSCSTAAHQHRLQHVQAAQESHSSAGCPHGERLAVGTHVGGIGTGAGTTGRPAVAAACMHS